MISRGVKMRKISFKEFLEIQIRFIVARMQDGVASGLPQLTKGALESALHLMKLNNVEVVDDQEIQEIQENKIINQQFEEYRTRTNQTVLDCSGKENSKFNPSDKPIPPLGLGTPIFKKPDPNLRFRRLEDHELPEESKRYSIYEAYYVDENGNRVNKENNLTPLPDDYELGN